MKPCALLPFLGLLAACSSETLPVSLQIHELTPEGLTVEVVTAPGVRASQEYSGLASGPVSDANGRAFITVPRKEWSYDAISVSAYVDGSTRLKKRFGNASLTLPFPRSRLTQIPENEPLYVTYLDGAESKVSVEEGVTITSGPASAKPKKPAMFDRLTKWAPKENAFTFFLAAPPGSKLDLGGSVVDVANGLSKVDVPSEVLTLSVEMGSLSDKGPVELSIPVTVTKDGQTRARTIVLGAASWHDTPWWLAARMDGVEKGQVFRETPVVEALLLRTSRDKVVHFGAAGRAGQARWVALAHPKPRREDSHGRPCPLHSYADLDITVLEAHAGQKVATRHFKAPDVACEGYYVKGQSETVWEPEEKEVTAWLEAGMAKGWK
jgi:hypothetical protein